MNSRTLIRFFTHEESAGLPPKSLVRRSAPNDGYGDKEAQVFADLFPAQLPAHIFFNCAVMALATCRYSGQMRIELPPPCLARLGTLVLPPVHRSRIDRILQVHGIVLLDHVDARAAVFSNLIDFATFQQPE